MNHLSYVCSLSEEKNCTSQLVSVPILVKENLGTSNMHKFSELLIASFALLLSELFAGPNNLFFFIVQNHAQ